MLASRRLPTQLLWLALGALFQLACDGPVDDREQRSEVEQVVASILLGDGAACFSDLQCGPPDARGACVLATCFGLLTTDNHVARAALVERLARSRPEVQVSARILLREALSDKSRTRSGRLGAVAGLGVLLSPGGACGEACAALREACGDEDETVAVASRLALARRADETVLASLLDDTRLGTEHLRVASATALGSYVGSAGDGEVIVALMALISDRSPAVRSAAVRSLAPVAQIAEVRGAFDKARDTYGGGLGYLIDRLRLDGKRQGAR